MKGDRVDAQAREIQGEASAHLDRCRAALGALAPAKRTAISREYEEALSKPGLSLEAREEARVAWDAALACWWRMAMLCQNVARKRASEAKIALSKSRFLTEEDLEQLGLMGCLRAAQTWDDRKASSFKSWCSVWARAMIGNEIRDGRGLSNHMNTKLIQISAATEFLRKRYGREPHPAQVARWLDLDPDLVVTLPSVGENSSLESDGDDGISIGERLADEFGDPEERVKREQICRRVRASIDTLDPRKLHIVRGTRDGKTLEEIGRDLCLSKERIRQLRREAFLILREILSDLEP